MGEVSGDVGASLIWRVCVGEVIELNRARASGRGVRECSGEVSESAWVRGESVCEDRVSEGAHVG